MAVRKISSIILQNRSDVEIYYNFRIPQGIYLFDDESLHSSNKVSPNSTVELTTSLLFPNGSSDMWLFLIECGGPGNPFSWAGDTFIFDKDSIYTALFDIVSSKNDTRMLHFKGLVFSKFRPKEKINDVYSPEPMYDEKKDKSDFNNAQRGFVKGTDLQEVISSENKAVAWDMPSYSFIDGEAPKSVHPNLWRMEKLNNFNGIFQVYPKVDGVLYMNAAGVCDSANLGLIYQARSYDLATMTFVKGSDGWIVIDPLGGTETVKEAWKQFKKVVGGEPNLKAILITHSHVDHYKGVGGLLDAVKQSVTNISQDDYIGFLNDPNNDKYARIKQEVEDKVLIVAPVGFYEEAVSENLYLGNCMARRAIYMYGSGLPHSIYGSVGSGLGKTVGTESGFIPMPSFEITPEKGSDCVTLSIDGIEFTFQNVPGTEAPAEMHIGFRIKDGDKEVQILCPGENVTHTMHNLLTPRGAKVRDPKAFGKAIDRALELFPDTQIIIGTHHWPTWNETDGNGNVIDNCRDIMEKERDMYYFFNDQVIRMLNMGMNMEEIAENFKLPDSLNNEYYNRGYYGTINHDVKAVAQRYIGWWDGNPANYFKYPDTEVARRFVMDMGGENAILEKAKQYFAAQDYRWTVELTRQLVFFNPANTAARQLEADALEQLGYSFEAGTWRNIFLSAALELRGLNLAQGMPGDNNSFVQTVRDNLKGLTPDYAFEYLSVLINGQKAADTKQGQNFIIQFESPEKVAISFNMNNGVLHHKVVECVEYPFITFTSVREFADDWYYYKKGTKKSDMAFLYECIDFIDGQWHIIEPLKDNKPVCQDASNVIEGISEISMSGVKQSMYMQWCVTSQAWDAFNMDVVGSDGKTYLVINKDSDRNGDLEQISSGITQIHCDSLVLRFNGKKYKVFVNSSDIIYKGSVKGVVYNIACEDQTDNDINDIVINLSFWDKKG